MADVELEIIDLVTGESIGIYPLILCMPETYGLGVGNYSFIATYLKTGERLQADLYIVEGENPPLDFEFTPVTHTLTINATTGGTTDPASGTYMFDAGTLVTVTAYPDLNQYFQQWTLNSEVHRENPITITMNADYVLTPSFAETPPPPPPPVEINLPMIGGITVAVVDAALIVYYIATHIFSKQ